MTVRFSDGTVYGHKGHINFVDVTVDKSTDTILVRATIPNPDDTLVDGQLVRVTVGMKTPQQKLVIPQAALIADQQGTYVFIVEDGKAAVRRVKPGAEVGANVVIELGLKAGDLVIVEGFRGSSPERRSSLRPCRSKKLGGGRECPSGLARERGIPLTPALSPWERERACPLRRSLSHGERGEITSIVMRRFCHDDPLTNSMES